MPIMTIAKDHVRNLMNRDKRRIMRPNTIVNGNEVRDDMLPESRPEINTKIPPIKPRKPPIWRIVCLSAFFTNHFVIGFKSQLLR